MAGSPAWASIEEEDSVKSLTYEQELQSLIQQRTGKPALPELTEIPGEQAILELVERELIEEAAAEQAAEVEEVVVVVKATEEPVSAVKVQAIRESEAAQQAAAAPAPASVVKPGAGAGPEGFNQSAVIVIGGLATVAIAAVALSGNGSSAAAPATPAATPSDPPPAPPSPPTDAAPPPPVA